MSLFSPSLVAQRLQVTSVKRNQRVQTPFLSMPLALPLMKGVEIEDFIDFQSDF